MSCNLCQARFTFFTKEIGCPKCGFSFCSKCLKYKYHLPNIGEKKICGRCYNSMKNCPKNSAMTTPAEDFSIPEGLTEPLVPIDITNKIESLENPSKPPIVMYRRLSKLDKLVDGLDPADQEIVNRLKKLKGEDKQGSPATEEEIKRRLALLKDQDPDLINQPTHEYRVDTRTDQQKTDDLISEYLDILAIKKSHEDIDQDIRARLDKLRGIDTSKCSNLNFGNTTEKIIEKALAEAALEAKYGEVDDINEPSADTSNDQDLDLASCVMCDNTANLVICKGCTGDLYCPTCFESNHDDFELHKHRTVKYSG